MNIKKNFSLIVKIEIISFIVILSFVSAYLLFVENYFIWDDHFSKERSCTDNAGIWNSTNQGCYGIIQCGDKFDTQSSIIEYTTILTPTIIDRELGFGIVKDKIYVICTDFIIISDLDYPQIFNENN